MLDAFGNAIGNSIVASMMPATPEQAAKTAREAGKQAVLNGATPQEAKAIELQTYARESGGTVEAAGHVRTGTGSFAHDDNEGFWLSNGSERAFIGYGASQSDVSDFLGNSAARDLGMSYAAQVMGIRHGANTAFTDGMNRGFENSVRPGVVAQQRQQRQVSNQLDAINRTIYEDMRSGWFNKAKNVTEASWNLLSRTGDVSNLDSAPLWKGLAGHGDMEFRQDMSTVLTLGANKDPRYMRWLSQVDVSQLNQMSPEKRAGTMFDMWATGVHPSNPTFSDGSPVVESLRNTNAVNTAITLHTNKPENLKFISDFNSSGVLGVQDPTTNVRGYWWRPIKDPFDSLGWNAMMDATFPKVDWEQHYIGSWTIDKVEYKTGTKIGISGHNDTSWRSLMYGVPDSYATPGPLQTINWKYEWSESENKYK
ncbi:hypothetical protein [Rheinheimera faecalis]|uniref:hypothetical protein n=1 Tax=Rheinheimera faecalis TaxID=2901141 RepID=UPI001E4291FC|nr:hypothetical protein [Rheinheimera faecalis]